MSRKDVTVTETTGRHAYCRRWDNSLAQFDDYGASSLLVTNTTAKMMWEQTADYMIFGADAEFTGIGFSVDTVADIGALTWEFWNGSGWTSFTPIHDGTTGFTENGYLAWDYSAWPWASSTIDGQAAFWIKATVASISIAPKFLHLLRNLVLSPPTNLLYRPNPDRFERDVNSSEIQKDIPYTGPLGLTARVIFKSVEYDQLILLADIWDKRSSVYIKDEAQTSPISLTADSYYKNCSGWIENIQNTAFPSEFKMTPGQFNIDFGLSAATAVI